jgi:hypothetical protein
MLYKIAINIHVYKGLSHLKKYLPLILIQTGEMGNLIFEVIIADDNLSDGACER